MHIKNYYNITWLIIFLIVIFTIKMNIYPEDESESYINYLISLFKENTIIISNGFDFPVGKPNAKKYYVAQKFGEKNPDFGYHMHLGEDWNGVRGGNTDLGDPVFAVSNGIVSYAKDSGIGWGNIVMIIHCISGKTGNKYVTSLYGHLREMDVAEGDFVQKGQKIGAIGNVNGTYFAHLHFEIRNIVTMPIGGGYSNDLTGFLNPTDFIKRNRKL